MYAHLLHNGWVAEPDLLAVGSPDYSLSNAPRIMVTALVVTEIQACKVSA